MRRARRARPKRAGWLWGVLGMLLLAVAGVYLSLPLIIRHLLPLWLEKQGITLQVEAVRQEILAGDIVLSGVAAMRQGPVFSADEVVLSLDLGALFRGQARLDRISAGRGELKILRDSKRWLIGGVPASWARHVGRAELTDFLLRTEAGGLETLRIENASVQRSSIAANGPVTFRLAGEIDSGQIKLIGEAWPGSEQTELVGEISLQDVALQRIVPRIREPELLVEAAMTGGFLRWQALLTPGERRIEADIDGSLRLHDLRLVTSEKPYGGQDVFWRGEGNILVEQGVVSTIDFRGQAELNRWETLVGGAEPSGRRIVIEDAVWEGRLQWSRAATLSAGLQMVGDAELGRLVVGLAEDQVLALERVVLWGMEQVPKKPLRIGRIEADGIAGGGRSQETGGGSLRLVAPDWRAAGMQSGSLEVDDGPAFRQQFLDLSDLEFFSAPFQRNARLGQARLEGVAYQGGRWQAASVALHKLALSHSSSSKDAPVLSLGKALFLDLALVPSAYLSVAEGRLGDLDIRVAKEARAGWQLPLLGPLEGEPGHLRVAVGALRIEGGSRLALEDRSVSPPYRIALADVRARLAGWDTDRPTDSGRFTLDGIAGDGGRLAISGRVGPLEGPQRIALHGEASGFQLAELPPGLNKALLGGIQDATLAAWLDFRAENERWEAYADLRFSGVELSSGRSSDLDNGLRFLRDDRGGLRLAVELQAERSEHAVEATLRRGAEAAMRVAIEDHYGSLGIGVDAARAALRDGQLRLRSVFFQPGSASFDRMAASHLEALADRMQHRPFTRVRVCAYATFADVRHEGPEGQVQLAPLPQQQREEALAISGLRGNQVREQLVSRLGLAEQRLIPCEPDYDAREPAQPRVELTLVVAR